MADNDDKKTGAPRGGKPRFGGPKKFGAKRFDAPSGGPRPAKAWGDKGNAARDRRPPSPASASAGVPPQEGEAGQSSERIAKRLARAGIASRRDAEALIADGRVRVNGAVLTSPAFNVSAADRIELDGTEIPPIERTRLFLFHKPAGVVTTNRDPEGRRTVFDVLPKDLPRLMTVGRLDITTEGLLLMTNDGGLARVLELPATGWLRRYRVRVHGKVEAEALVGLKDGMAVDGVFYGSIEASLDREQGSNAWLTIGLREGKNREVKNILGALGLEVNRLIRISYGPFQLGELAEGAVQELKGRTLRDQLGERLIEESGANFEAPIARPFSNKPVQAHDEPRPEHDRPKVVRDGVQGRESAGGLIKQRRRDPRNDRDAALSRLTTRPDRKPSAKAAGGKPFGAKPFAGKSFGGKSFGGKDGEHAEPAKPRTSNVWMAPGARPQGKKAAAASESKPAKRSAAPHPYPLPARGGERGSPTSTPPSPRPSRGEGKGEGRRGDRKFGDKEGLKGNKPPFGKSFGGKKGGASSDPRTSSPRDRGPGKGGRADRRR